MKLFVSVGSTYSEEQEGFVQGLETFLQQNGCERLTVGRGRHYAKQPIAAAKDLMGQADGIIVVAFTRFLINSAAEKPGSDQASEICGRRTPTVWNHIEAAMAYGLGVPMFMIIEEGLYQEAMVKDRYEYRALVTKIDKKFLLSEEFIATFKDWQAAIALRKPSEPEIDVSTLTLGKISRNLTPGQIWSFGAAIFSLLSIVAAAAYWIGWKFPPT